ncbi:Tex-like protein [Caldalkalibacillus thermarum TA2.A1]|uniref:Tex-like protein n=2 Tax=Caldalkalibacillus thermarum (strain TA2.A1) TaxID=986075 RepID=F5L792_CALTT|nr:Tex-like protein [Caldalkalibacillus thermarum TA2.A1]
MTGTVEHDHLKMEEALFNVLHQELNIPKEAVKRTIALLQEGNTVPFVARYRKEVTGGLNEEQIRAIEERYRYLQNLWQRKEEVLRLIAEQGKLTEELKEKIVRAEKLQEVEDYYRPFRPKRRTRATVAKEKGLEPLAERLVNCSLESPEKEAERYLSTEHELHTVEDVLQGAMDIIAEWIADEAEVRQWIRDYTFANGRLVTELKNQEHDPKQVYRMYYEYQSPIPQLVSHRVLAINRAEKEEVIKVKLEIETETIKRYLQKRWVKNERSPAASYIDQAIVDSYKRLIAPAIEREIRRELTEQAEEQAIDIFAKNLRALLLQPPVRGKTVLGIDPAYRTGCKLAVVDPTGKVLAIDVIYPVPPHNKIEEAKRKLLALVDKHQVDIVAIGNGTASRETEQFVAQVIQETEHELAYIMINEAGASVYSASPLAKEEFPDLDVAERSAISIARRLQDPLAELVKIDPKSIGVGQYQHDVSQTKLSESLSFVVETVVNQVGVDVNTASVSLLQYVSGLNKSVAKEIVKYREQHGRLTSRRQLLDVPRLGAKTYEQAVGFMRIFDGEDPFDQTPIHPESYPEAERFLTELGFEKHEIGSPQLIEALQGVDIEDWANRLDIGVPTLTDIIEALQKPRRDPRDELAQPLLLKDILKIEDLKAGMQLEGTVRNVVDFGAFVDIGLKNDGLVHISQLSKHYVRHPLDVVSVGDIVTVWVKEVDLERERVSLTLIPPLSNQSGDA